MSRMASANSALVQRPEHTPGLFNRNRFPHHTIQCRHRIGCASRQRLGTSPIRWPRQSHLSPQLRPTAITPDNTIPSHARLADAVADDDPLLSRTLDADDVLLASDSSPSPSPPLDVVRFGPDRPLPPPRRARGCNSPPVRASSVRWRSSIGLAGQSPDAPIAVGKLKAVWLPWCARTTHDSPDGTTSEHCA